MSARRLHIFFYFLTGFILGTLAVISVKTVHATDFLFGTDGNNNFVVKTRVGATTPTPTPIMIISTGGVITNAQINSSQISSGTFGSNTGSGTYTFPSTVAFTGGSKINDVSGKLQLQVGGTSNGSAGTGNIYFLDRSGFTEGRYEAIAMTLGDGADGAITVSSTINLNTNAIAGNRASNCGGSPCADGIAYKVDMTQATGNLPNTGNTSILTTDTPSGVVAGDEILLINLQGASGDTSSVGNYEFLTISSISTKTITFTTSILNNYKGTTATNQKVVIQRVPHYTNVTLCTSNGNPAGCSGGPGSITASAWDGLATTPTGVAGYYTGIVAFRASGTVTVNSSSSINVNSLGYRGGSSVTGSQAYQGEGFGGTGTTSTAQNNGGGGGGTGNWCTGLNCAAAGGGGGYASTAGTGQTGGSGAGGTGGSSYGSSNLSTMFLGGGGGGGGGFYYGPGGVGGIGAGIIYIAASNLTVTSTGTISANGGTGGAGGATGTGAGGAGGSIFIMGTNTITLGSSIVTAAAGSGGAQNGGGTPGAASAGRIYVFYQSAPSGTTSPAATTKLNYGTLYLSATNTASADLAEYYVSGDPTISAGDVVTISDTKVLDSGGKEIVTKGVLRKSTISYDKDLIGIISTDPGVIMGSIDGSPNKADQRMLALAGRVPVKIDSDSPPIHIGDYLTSSTKPGFAQKVTTSGFVVARALEGWAPKSGKTTIDVFVHLAYYDPSVFLTSTGELKIVGDNSNNFSLNNADNSHITSVGAFGEIAVAKLKAGAIEAKRLVVGGLDIIQKLQDLSARIDHQQQEIDQLKTTINQLKAQ